MNEREYVIREMATLYLDPEDAMERPLKSMHGFSINELLEAGRFDDVLDWIASAQEGVAT